MAHLRLGSIILRYAACLGLGAPALCAVIPPAAAQQDGSRPVVIPVTPEAKARPMMAPIADEDAEAKPKPKLIRVRPTKPKPAPETSAAPADAEQPAEPTPAPEVQPRRGRPTSAPEPQDTPAPTPIASAAPTASAPAPAADQPAGEENYEYCNRTSFAISVAVGTRDEAQLRTRGWWTIYPGDCKPIIKGKLMPTSYFTFAKTHFAHSGPMRIWGGSHMLCVGRGQFQASSDGTGVCAPGHEAQGFARIEMSGRSSWRTTLVETEALKTKAAAETAGLQRLLSDLSLYAGSPDGVASPGFRQALADARTKYGYPTDEPYSQTYLRLLVEAAKVQSQTGLTFCNRSSSALWVALGLENAGRKIARGWWRIQANQCEKVIKDRLTQRLLFAHASNDKGGGDGVWTGKSQFCTKDSVFEMEGGEDCESRGGERTGFFAIDTRGNPGAVYSFTSPQPARAK